MTATRAPLTQRWKAGANHILNAMQVMQNGDTVEVGLFGAEGFVGHPILLNINESSLLVNVQMPGEAFKVDSSVLRQMLPQLPTLERMLSRFAYLQALQAQQIAACNGLHEIEQRLARWILMTQDRVRVEFHMVVLDRGPALLRTDGRAVDELAGADQLAVDEDPRAAAGLRAKYRSFSSVPFLTT